MPTTTTPNSYLVKPMDFAQFHKLMEALGFTGCLEPASELDDVAGVNQYENPMYIPTNMNATELKR